MLIGLLGLKKMNLIRGLEDFEAMLYKNVWFILKDNINEIKIACLASWEANRQLLYSVTVKALRNF